MKITPKICKKNFGNNNLFNINLDPVSDKTKLQKFVWNGLYTKTNLRENLSNYVFIRCDP